ncbi:lipid IV(A) 3-deoxy-D-manno-octulosonic acid transferase [Vibrio makurazakiensis]|uniref:lipid IV(A) 3-deoxy-D-manno-octulosonic acid transferase n=1 Tax=Vibrio makurazakiensis TaxID=2910250 RepID=UPI003D0E8A8F
MIRFVYTLLLIFIAPFLLFGLYKKKEGKPSIGHRWREHFGITPKLASNQKPIWIHAVSVGESIAVTPLIKAIKQQNPNQVVVVTTTTPTGAEQIEKLGDLVEHRYMPIDFSFAIKGFLKVVRPSQLLIMETELWPNTLRTVANADIPITVLNARLSERSYKHYAKVQRLFDLLANNLSHILCQHQDDADRFLRLGVAEDKISITGSLKFDIDVSNSNIQEGQNLRRTLGIDRPVWIAASTHQGEDEQIISAHQQILEKVPSALLILVPRHPERFISVTKLCQGNGLSTISRTSQEVVTGDTEVYLGDTMGEMMALIAASDICFMGGSLIGDKVGGHNLLEPAALGKPTLTGPSYYNFLDITQQLTRVKATTVVSDSTQLAEQLTHLFSNSQLRLRMGNSALQVVKQNQGALKKTLHAILPNS